MSRLETASSSTFRGFKKPRPYAYTCTSVSTVVIVPAASVVRTLTNATSTSTSPVDISHFTGAGRGGCKSAANAPPGTITHILSGLVAPRRARGIEVKRQFTAREAGSVVGVRYRDGMSYSEIHYQVCSQTGQTSPQQPGTRSLLDGRLMRLKVGTRRCFSSSRPTFQCHRKNTVINRVWLGSKCMCNSLLDRISNRA